MFGMDTVCDRRRFLALSITAAFGIVATAVAEPVQGSGAPADKEAGKVSKKANKGEKAARKKAEKETKAARKKAEDEAAAAKKQSKEAESARKKAAKRTEKAREKAEEDARNRAQSPAKTKSGPK